MDSNEEFVAEIKANRELILVEGQKDKRALEIIGATAPIAVLSKQPIFVTVESIAAHHNKVIILTDTDKQGKKLYSVLSKNFKRLGVIVDDRFRLFLMKSKVSHIEGLVSFLNKIH